LFILLLPFETPGWFVLVLSFFTGITIDLFSNTPGIHAAATVFMGFLRPYILQTIAPRDGYEPGTFPRTAYMGFAWFFKYAFILVLVHHLLLFIIEVFKFSDFHFVLVRTLLSTIFSTLLILISQLVIRK
jgi:rod shape-determining protein MreD